MQKSIRWLMPLSHSNDFHFKASARDFSVHEVPLYDFSGEGEHLVLHIRKKELSTWEMLDILSSSLGIAKREIGYAGLKDKYALTTQYISLPAKYEKALAAFDDKRIKILESYRHHSKIRVGHLKGNRFRLRFKKVLGIQREKIDSVLDWIERNGSPNYFGMQRFGRSSDNWLEGKDIAEGRKRPRNAKMSEFLVSAYQSYLFNSWLSLRIEIGRLLEDFSERECEKILQLPTGTLTGVSGQKQFFKLLEGDIMMHYPYGRIFHVEDIDEERRRFLLADISPTGPIFGKKMKRASLRAAPLEERFSQEIKIARGSRRYAWIFPQDIERRYIEERAHYELSFYLPKGSYATTIVDMLKGDTRLSP